MSKSNGFIFFETIIAATVILVIFFMIVPSVIMIETEKKVLFDRRTIANLLHHELQIFSADDYLNKEKTYKTKHNGLLVFFQITPVDELIKGCAKWENVKKVYEEICFYDVQK